MTHGHVVWFSLRHYRRLPGRKQSISNLRKKITFLVSPPAFAHCPFVSGHCLKSTYLKVESLTIIRQRRGE